LRKQQTTDTFRAANKYNCQGAAGYNTESEAALLMAPWIESGGIKEQLNVYARNKEGEIQEGLSSYLPTLFPTTWCRIGKRHRLITIGASKHQSTAVKMSSYRPAILLGISAICLLQGPVMAHPPPPQANDIFGTVNGCASALVEMDTNQDGMVKKDEYFNFVNLLADFLCVPPRPKLDLEIQTVFFSIACLCQEREGFEYECCFGTGAAIFTEGAADAITRTEDQDSYLRAACLLTQSILGPQQCTAAPATLAPEAIVTIRRVAPFSKSGGGLSDQAMWAIIIGSILLALLCCLLLCCVCGKKKKEDEEEEEEVEEVIIQPEDVEEGEIEPKDKEVDVDEVRKIEPPVFESNSVPAPAPAPTPVILPMPVIPAADEEDSEASSNVGRKIGMTGDDDSDEENNRKFGGEGLLPGDPAPDGIVLRHVEVEKEGPPEYEYPEREIIEQKLKREDSGQILEPYVPDGGVYDPQRDMNFKGYTPDGGVYDPQRPTKAPVVFSAPKYQRPKKPKKDPYDARKQRKALAMGDGEVWESLAAHEEAKEKSKFVHCRALLVFVRAARFKSSHLFNLVRGCHSQRKQI
jgi:uncharacterized Zn finger protein (UPF0148 family)